MVEIMLSSMETSTYWPMPVCSRERSAIRMPMVANMPAVTSATE